VFKITPPFNRKGNEHHREACLSKAQLDKTNIKKGRYEQSNLPAPIETPLCDPLTN
jgi:hypothetical protein